MKRLGLAIMMVLLGPTAAWGQGADFGAPKKPANADNGDLDSQEGLESATPTDDVNELNGGGGNASGSNGADDASAGGGGNGAGGSGGGGGDLNIGGNSPDDDKGLFGDENGKAPDAKASSDSMEKNFNNSFGGGDGTQKSNAAAGPANGAGPANPAAGGKGGQSPDAAPPTLNAAPSAAPNAAPASPAPANAASAAPPPVNLAPNASPPNATPANATPAAGGNNNNNNTSDSAVQPATGQEDLVKKPPEAPPIEAPPLPPPNDFAGAPPVPGTMRIMADGEAPEEYKVEPGDTLWDICDQLLDEPAYWPKLWALNPEIKNPHFIFPNMKLRFYPGDDDTPPYLQVVSEDDVIPIDKGDLDEEDLVAEKVIFPTEAPIDEQVTEVIGPEGVEPLQDEILSGGQVYQGGEIKVQVPGFIFANEKEPLGYIIGGREGEVSLQPGIKGLIESTGDISVGTLYSVLRPAGAVENSETGESVGYKYYFVGNIRIERDVGDSVFVGKPQDNRLSIYPDDIVVNFISTKRSVPQDAASPPLNSVDAYVVGFEYPDGQLAGAGRYVFIDKGNGDGVSPGMYLPLFQTPGFVTSSFKGATDLPIDYEYIGVMRIIDATDAGAVGYVLRNTREIRLGDRTSKG